MKSVIFLTLLALSAPLIAMDKAKIEKSSTISMSITVPTDDHLEQTITQGFNNINLNVRVAREPKRATKSKYEHTSNASNRQEPQPPTARSRMLGLLNSSAATPSTAEDTPGNQPDVLQKSSIEEGLHSVFLGRWEEESAVVRLNRLYKLGTSEKYLQLTLIIPENCIGTAVSEERAEAIKKHLLDQIDD